MRAAGLNPEFVRNVWLELTPQRLVAMPAILLLALTCAWLFADEAPARAVGNAALFLFLIVTAGWGARLAAESLTDEFAQSTWDAQRGATLPPWSMTWGKLFGGSVFAWYGGAFCLAAYAIALGGTAPAFAVLRTMLDVIAFAVLMQAFALLSTLSSWRKARTLRQRQGAGIVAWLFMLLIVTQLVSLTSALELEGDLGTLSWYGLDVPVAQFLLASLIAFAAWFVIGVYRLMRAELQVRNGPFVWLAFIAFLILYCGGGLYARALDIHLGHLSGATSPLLMHLGLGVTIAWVAAYVMCFYERKDPVQWRRLIEALRARQWRRALERVPLWLVTFDVFVLLGAAFAASCYASLAREDALSLAAGTLAVALFLCRDLALVMWLNLAPSQKRADGAAAIYLLVLYVLLPALLGAAGLDGLLGLFLPFASFEQPLWSLAGAPQALIMLLLVRRRWQATRAAQGHS